MQQVVSLDRPRTYTGHQLRSLWIYDTFGISGDAIVVFRGGCDVDTESLVDAEDRHDEAIIRASEMLHFIIEHFDDRLPAAVLRQRLFIAIIKETLQPLLPDRHIRRDGDDLYVEGSKLTVSVATISPVSTLIHTGINIDPEEAPVDAIGLMQLGVETAQFAEAVTEAYAQEIHSAAFAATKVRGVQ